MPHNMWTPDYDIIVETLTGSEFEVTVRETDTIGYLKYRIKKYEGIPVSQQHILFNQNELKDATVLKDIPLVRGSRLTLVLGMRGGPISARRVATDNWYDLSDVLNGTNRGQLTPIEPLTISTTGVKVLLYKDCKKNINRLMKLRKHHLHSLGSSGNSSGIGASGGSSSSSMTGNSIKCTSSSSSTSTSSARQQLKFFHKHMAAAEDNMGATGEAQDQQWLMDNITTLKKMKQLRQSLEAKKKKKRRPSAPGEYNDELTQELHELQVDLEMNEKLQKWLHKVASNATHLSDTDVAAHLSSTSSAANLASAAAASSLATGGGSGLGGMYDRVRRRPVTTTAMGGAAAGSLGIDLARTSSSFARGGARKKDSAYQLSMDEYCLLAKSYEMSSDKKAAAAANKIVSTGVAEDRFATTTTTTNPAATSSSPSNADEESAERLKKRRESSQFEERLLTQFYDNSSPQCENFFRAFATTSAAEGAAILKEASGGGNMGGGATGPTAASASGGERVSKFKWRFHGDGASSAGGSCVAGQGTTSRGGNSDFDLATAGVSPKATETDVFMNSLLMKRNNSSNIQRFASTPFGVAAEDYGGSGGLRWSDRLVMSGGVDERETDRPTKQKEERDLEQAWRDVLKEEAAAMDVRAVMVDDLVVLRQETPIELETVIIEKAVEAEDGFLSAACREILNDPAAAFDDEEEEEDQQGEHSRFELVDTASDESELKSAGDVEGDEEEDDDDDEESCLGHVLMYEDEERGEVTFLGGDENEREVCGGRDTGIRRISTTREDRDRAVFPGFLPFDESYDEEDEDDEEEDEEEKLGSCGYATEIRVMSNPGDGEVNYEEEDGEEEEVEGDEEEEVELNCTENDAFEFDDFAYFPSSPPPSSSPALLRPECDTEKEKSFLPKIVVEKRSAGNSKKDEDLDCIGEERLMGPSLPEIINRNAERRRERSRYERTMFGEENGGGSPTVLKRDREEHHPRGQKSDKQDQMHLPDIKLLESDLKMMGLDVILNDSDDSFERAIKRHFRNESKAATSSTARATATGECLLRSGNEELKKLKQVEDNADWLIQLDVELDNPKGKGVDEPRKNKANRCAKCQKRLGIIMIMQCHCGLFFCAQHRYAEAHDCAYDFKGNGKQILAKDNPLVVGEKLPKI